MTSNPIDFAATLPANDSASHSPASARSGWRLALLLILATATLVILPMFFLGNASGHDFQFHVASWLDVHQQWRQGIVFPRWAEFANWQFGEPRFIFYPPLSWLLGAALGSALPWDAVPGAFIWLVLVFGGICTWRLTREFLPPGQSAAAAVFFMLNPYQLVVIYYRSDFAELLAAAFFPLLFFVTLRMSRAAASRAARPTAGPSPWRDVPLLAATFAAIWLANAPAGVMASYTLALLLFATAGVACISARSPRPIAPGAAATITGFGLAAFYILPAAHERFWVQISQVLGENLDPARNFIFSHSNDPEFVYFNWKVSFIACVVFLVTGIAAVFVARRRREFPIFWRASLALGAVCVLAMFRITLPLWRHLPELQFLQFPWRWLLPLGLVFALFTAAAPGASRKAQIACWLAVSLVIAATGAAIISDCWWDSEDANFLIASIHSGLGYEGTDEYTPLGCDRYDLPQNAPRIVRLDPASDKFVPVAAASGVQITKWTAEQKSFISNSAAPAILAVQALNYPAWQIALDGSPAASLISAPPAPTTRTTAQSGAASSGVAPNRSPSALAAFTRASWPPRSSSPEPGPEPAPHLTKTAADSVACRIVLAVPSGAHRIEVRFARTADRTAGGAISAITALLLLALALAQRRRRTRAGSGAL
ncbi:MAG: hypothetical protein WBX12_12275 [Candidatus Acidiferrales bacterium]